MAQERESLMHTLKTSGGTAFVFDGDFHGIARIVTRDHQSTEVPAADLLEFAAEFVRRERVSALEDASAREILLGGR